MRLTRLLFIHIPLRTVPTNSMYVIQSVLSLYLDRCDEDFKTKYFILNPLRWWFFFLLSKTKKHTYQPPCLISFRKSHISSACANSLNGWIRKRLKFDYVESNVVYITFPNRIQFQTDDKFEFRWCFFFCFLSSSECSNVETGDAV